MKLIHLFILTVSIFVLIVTGIAQHESDTGITRLEEAPVLKREMDGYQVHTYKIRLDKGKFFYAVITQIGIDVVVRVTDPDGQLLKEVDSPNGTHGMEPVTLASEKSGDFTLEVVPLDPLASKGQYTIAVEKISDAATTIWEKIDQIFVPWDKNDFPGAAIAVVKEGRIIFEKGYGMANLEYDIRITPTTVFHMASVSKQFTAFSIARLVQEGKITLDDDIRTYLPEIHDFGNKITINHLLHHTSGLRDQWNLLMIAGWRLDDVITREHILKMVCRQKELNFAPGDMHMYSNTGYTLLAEIVARVSGESFPQWTRENIFDPLNMKNTLFYDDHEKIVKNRAYSYYTDDSGELKKSVLSYANVGATSLFATAEDLAKWAMNFDNPVVGNPVLIKMMEERGVLNNGDTIVYAFGQGVGTHKGLKFIGHSGADAGYHTYLGRFPDQKFSVIVLSNLRSFNPGGIALQVADLYLKDLETDEKIEEEPAPPFQTIKVAPEILETYAGLYQLPDEEKIEIRRNGTQLNFRMPGSGWERIYPVQENQFLSLDSRSKYIFERDHAEKVNKILVDRPDKKFSAGRITPFSLTEEQLTEYTGTYYSDELLTAYTIVLQDSVLLMQHQRNPDFTIEPESEDTFDIAGLFGQLRFERSPEGRISGYRLNFGRVQKLLFTRMGMK